MRIYGDTADLDEIARLNEHPWVSGFTTNPTIFKQIGVTQALRHAKDILSLTRWPVSFDGPAERIWELGPNAIAKVVDPLSPMLRQRKFNHHQRVNLTAVCAATDVPKPSPLRGYDIISVFAGRIMDCGHDPQPTIDAAKTTNAHVLWASTREPYHLRMAELTGCHIITITPAVLAKLDDWWGMPLERCHDVTVEQFIRDAEGVVW